MLKKQTIWSCGSSLILMFLWHIQPFQEAGMNWSSLYCRHVAIDCNIMGIQVWHDQLYDVIRQHPSTSHPRFTVWEVNFQLLLCCLDNPECEGETQEDQTCACLWQLWWHATMIRKISPSLATFNSHFLQCRPCIGAGLTKDWDKTVVWART